MPRKVTVERPHARLIVAHIMISACDERREKERLTVIRDEAQDHPAVRGYEDGVALQGRCRVELLTRIASGARAHSTRMNLSNAYQFSKLATYI
jgi:hypothetical protein